MSNPAFIVDGHQEQKIIQQICPNSPVRMLNCNGKDVALPAAAERIASLIRLMGNKYYPYIIVFDRESRVASASQIKESLEKLIRSEGISDDLVIGVPDRMIENWILADWDNVKSKGKLKSSKILPICEGRNGKGLIKRLLPNDGKYQETIQGVDWFLGINVKIAFEKSPSFREFSGTLRKVGCKWLRPCFEGIMN
ncbi:MAG: DUF4276 family protein [Nitrospiraceae bacterium]|nr:DUF4276 family protein [Nitrospiraceae bacterium]